MNRPAGDEPSMGLIAERVRQAVPMLVLVSAMVFALLHAAPGGPLAVYLENPNVQPADLERLRVRFGLDRPVPLQYLAWVTGFLRGDWGFSFVDGRPVTARILERLPATLELMGAALLIAVLVSIPAGVRAAARPRRMTARLVDSLGIAGISLPAFWFGLVLQLLFGVWLAILPTSGRTSLLQTGWTDRLAHLILPATVLGLLHAAAWSRYMRTAVTDALASRWMLAARARGLPEPRLVWRHALRNALLPFVTVVLLDAALLFSGAVVTESVFAWPGLGGLFTEALSRRDYPVLMAFLMLSSLAVVTLNLLADLLYHWLDPRVRR